jgi:hypothetical protein
MKGRTASPALKRSWARVGQRLMNPDSQLFTDLIADIEVSPIPLDPRLIDQFI